jgi:4-diphosphocytidyl-2-C-methyl-D-erythritol kinase
MREVTLKAPAKVNLFLNLVGRREDGYHQIETIFQAITLFDTITLLDSQDRGIRLECDASSVPLNEHNLVWRAAKAVLDWTHLCRGVVIRLKKRIPIASGLGGGSSDAASTLVGLNRLWDIGLDRDVLVRMARELGADVPFFILGGTALGRGIGDDLTPIKTPPIHLVLITPRFSISTGQVYKGLKFRLTKEVLDITIVHDCMQKEDLPGLASHLYNILEEVSLKNYPYLRRLKERLIREGALGSLMSGSGPAIFGLAPSLEEAHRIRSRLGDIDEPVYVVSSLSPYYQKERR